jgi:hypothetical protein
MPIHTIKSYNTTPFRRKRISNGATQKKYMYQPQENKNTKSNKADNTKIKAPTIFTAKKKE